LNSVVPRPLRAFCGSAPPSRASVREDRNQIEIGQAAQGSGNPRASALDDVVDERAGPRRSGAVLLPDSIGTTYARRP
jgi:hypothetical protein